MSKRSVRIIVLSVLGILAFTAMVPRFLIKILFVAVPVIVMLFMWGRIGSSKKDGKTENEHHKAESTHEGGVRKPKGPVVDGTYKEVNSTSQYTSSKKENIDDSKVKDSERSEYRMALEHVGKIASSLYQICCMDIRNPGLRVNRLAKDIIREKYEESNDCRGFVQFRDYYLPTLRQTIENYSIMEKKSIIDQKIKDDMLSYLNSCEAAFTRIYNSMFDDDILNMEVQMEAMNLALKRDGLL